MICYIDCPNPYDPEGSWINIDTVETKEKAIELAKVWFGADDEGKVCLISMEEDEEDSEDSPVNLEEEATR